MWQLEPWAPSPKTQNFKVLCFGPNFIVVLFMSSMVIIWDYFFQKPSKKWYILSLCFFQASPKVSSHVDLGFPNLVISSLILWVFSPKSPIIHRLYNNSNLNARNSILWCIMSLILRSSAISRVFLGHWSWHSVLR